MMCTIDMPVGLSNSLISRRIYVLAPRKIRLRLPKGAHRSNCRPCEFARKKIASDSGAVSGSPLGNLQLHFGRSEILPSLLGNRHGIQLIRIENNYYEHFEVSYSFS